MDLDLQVGLPELQISIDLAFANLKAPQLISNGTRVAITPGDKVQAAFDAPLDLLKLIQQAPICP